MQRIELSQSALYESAVIKICRLHLPAIAKRIAETAQNKETSHTHITPTRIIRQGMMKEYNQDEDEPQ